MRVGTLVRLLWMASVLACGWLACVSSGQSEQMLTVGGTPTPLTVSFEYFHTWEVPVEPGAEYEILLDLQRANVDNLSGARILVLDPTGEYIARTDSSFGANVLTFVGPDDGLVEIRILPPEYGGDSYVGEFTVQIIRRP